jgi:hypothetical protein
MYIYIYPIIKKLFTLKVIVVAIEELFDERKLDEFIVYTLGVDCLSIS